MVIFGCGVGEGYSALT